MTHPIEIDDELLDRLRLIASELGGRDLPLDVVVRAMLAEAAQFWAAIAAARDTLSHT